MEERGVKKFHKIILDNRKKGSITGVKDVISFDLNNILLETEDGMLTIKGNDLHVGKLSVERGEVEISGNVESMIYSEVKNFKAKQESFLARMFK